MFGDGSSGALNVLTGTYELQPDVVHQFTSIYVATGATLTVPANTTGTVLYLLCQGLCRIDGTLTVSGRSLPGQYSRNVTVNGENFSFSSTAAGGAGGALAGYANASQGSGFGGGGAGGHRPSGPPAPAVTATAGLGASGGRPFGSFGFGGSFGTDAPNVMTQRSGQNGAGASAGGGGSAWSYHQASGTLRYLQYATGGAGGYDYGQNGTAGSISYSYASGSGSGTIYIHAGGGGGGGGSAGSGGLTLVIKALTLSVAGTIVTSGTNGQAGGSGGAGAVGAGPATAGCGGGGGGGGNGGDVVLLVGSMSVSGTISRSGGSGGAGGSGGSSGGGGSAGVAGSMSIDYALQPGGTLLLGGGPQAVTKHYTSINGSLAVGVQLNVRKVIAPVAGKEFVYRVYDSDGDYIGTWQDVESELQFTQRLNTPGTHTNVRLKRSADRVTEMREPLTTETGEVLTTEDGIDLIATYQTSNTIGEDTDVDLNYNVDIYAHYGGFEELVTEDGEVLTTEDGENFIVGVGAPLGIRIFSGFVLSYAARYGDADYVDVVLASHGHELSQQVIKNGSDTTRTYSSSAHDAIIKSILDTNPGTMSYDGSSLAPTSTPISQTFRLNTKLEGIEAVYNQTDPDWYWYGNVADNLVYLQERSASADHVLVFGKHIGEITIERSIESLRNEVYFVGGDTGSGILYKRYEDAPSIANWRKGLHRITDRRFTLAASAARRADKEMSRFKEPIYTTEVEIFAAVYDIETIQLGQTVGFANFGNFVDDLVLQIVSRSYTPYGLRLQLGELLDRQRDVIEDIQENLADEQFVAIPNAPS